MDDYYVEGQRNGHFLFLYPDGKPKEQGLFVKNKREGIHLRFHENGMMQDSTKYLNGKVIGNAFSWFENGSPSAKMALDTLGNETGYAIRYFVNKNISDEGEFGKGMKKNGRWTYYHDNGIKSAVVSYDYNVVVSKTCFDESGVEQPTCNLLIQNAEFPGGQENLEKYVFNHVEWPKIKFREKDGKIIIQVAFTIDRDGNVKDAKLVKSIHPAIDHAVLLAFINMPKWKPAKEFNRKLSVGFIFPISYRNR